MWQLVPDVSASVNQSQLPLTRHEHDMYLPGDLFEIVLDAACSLRI